MPPCYMPQRQCQCHWCGWWQLQQQAPDRVQHVCMYHQGYSHPSTTCGVRTGRDADRVQHSTFNANLCCGCRRACTWMLRHGVECMSLACALAQEVQTSGLQTSEYGLRFDLARAVSDILGRDVLGCKYRALPEVQVPKEVPSPGSAPRVDYLYRNGGLAQVSWQRVEATMAAMCVLINACTRALHVPYSILMWW